MTKKPSKPPVQQTQGWEKMRDDFFNLLRTPEANFSDKERFLWDWVEELLSSQKQEMVEKIERAERNAINEGIKKFGVYKYDYMEGVFIMKFSLLDILSALEKEGK